MTLFGNKHNQTFYKHRPHTHFLTSPRNVLLNILYYNYIMVLEMTNLKVTAVFCKHDVQQTTVLILLNLCLLDGKKGSLFLITCWISRQIQAPNHPNGSIHPQFPEEDKLLLYSKVGIPLHKHSQNRYHWKLIKIGWCMQKCRQTAKGQFFKAHYVNLYSLHLTLDI